MSHAEFRIDLRHLAKGRFSILLFKLNRDLPYIQFERNLLCCALSAQREGRPQSWMSGKRQFLLYGEDSYPNPAVAFSFRIPRKDKRCLREVHLFGDPLHLLITESASIGENRKRIAFKWIRRKYIPLCNRKTPWLMIHACPVWPKELVLLAMNGAYVTMHKILKPSDFRELMGLTRTFHAPILGGACLFHASSGSCVVVT